MIVGVNRFLDGLVRPEVPLLGRMRPAFQVCGFAGAAVAVGLVAALVRPLGLVPWVAGAMCLAGCVTFLAIAVASKLVRGRPTLVFYRHALAILGVTAGGLALLGQPVLRYLDVGAVAVMAFLAFGRVGCLMVGCCHGKPAGVGVRYRHDHAVFGFTPFLVGVRLFPTQALEAVAAFVMAAAGTAALVGAGPAPGLVLGGLAIGYAATRFLLETARGDQVRAIVAGFSEAQWMSLVVLAGVIALGATGVVPLRAWQIAVTAGLGFVVFFIAAWRFLGHAPRHRLLAPRHIHEVATALAELPRRQREDLTGVTVATTSLDICLSMSRLADEAGPIDHVAISRRGAPLAEEHARVLVDLVRDLHPGARHHQIVSGRAGVFHVLFHL